MLSSEADQVRLQVQTHGEVTPDAADYLETKIRVALRAADRPVTFARARLSKHEHEVPAVVVAQVNVELNGRPLRAQTRAATASEAIDLLEARLRSRLEHARRRRPTGATATGATPTGATPAATGTGPRAGVRLVKGTAVPMVACSVDTAIDELEFLDHDFHLFVESGTGSDSVVYRGPEGRYVLQQAEPEPTRLTGYESPVDLHPEAAPTLTATAVVDRMVLGYDGFVFFVDADRHRGCVVYRRHDGHLAELTSMR